MQANILKYVVKHKRKKQKEVNEHTCTLLSSLKNKKEKENR